MPAGGATVVHDLIRGETTFEHVHLDDPVIARADGSVLYNFAVAIDDLDAAITHVVRGEDHLSNTPKATARPASRQGRRLRRRARRAAIRAPAAAARPRRQEALQAPRCRIGAGAARSGLPAGGGAQLPRSARLGFGRRRHRPLDRAARGALRAGASQSQPGPLRRGQAALARRDLHSRALRRRARRSRARLPAHLRPASGKRRRSRSRAARGCGGDQPGEDPDARRLLAAVALLLHGCRRGCRGARALAW